MNFDLNDLLRDWPLEPGTVNVRRVVGSDGRDKLQLRIDLGLIQMETLGRPDGKEPHHCESLLEYFQSRARRAQKSGKEFALSSDDVGELQQEGIQYYHRYISFFQLSDYLGVIRDTQRNLDMFDFVASHVERPELAAAVEQFTPYVLMMNTRAKAALELDRKNHPLALEKIEDGMAKIRAFYERLENPELAAASPELSFLGEWAEEIRSQKPVTKLEKMHREMEKAIAAEAYEKAAELRDAIAALARKK